MAISLSTQDKLEYNFYPVTGGQVQFRVKAPHDAHIALTAGPSVGDPMYEVFIGGWGNSKSVIRKNRTQPDVAELATPDILNGNEHRGFWIRWENSTILVGKEGDAAAFLVYTDPSPFGIAYFGVCTGWGASGDWLIEAICIGTACQGGCRTTIKTADELKYNFHPITRGSVVIDVKAKSNAHIALTKSKGESSPMYEIMLGGWENTASVIRYDRKTPDKVRAETPNLLSPGEHKKFTISWLNGHIVVRAGNENGPVLMEWRDPNPFGIGYVGVRTGWGATGNWLLRFVQPGGSPTAAPVQAFRNTSASAPPAQYQAAGAPIWVAASNGVVPPGAIEGGRDDESLYVGRALHEGALLPGKVKPGHAVCYVPWGGAEHGKADYEVLCGANTSWVPGAGGNIPPNAVPGGETEEGEPLYVGRANHEGTVTVGKIQPSHGVLYIPFGGEEVSFPEFEILVTH